MIATFPSHPLLGLASSGFKPGGGSECHHFTGLHGRQAGQDILEVVPRRYAEAAAAFHDGVEDRALLPGPLVANEEPVFGTNLGRADGVLYADMLIMRTSFAQ